MLGERIKETALKSTEKEGPALEKEEGVDLDLGSYGNTLFQGGVHETGLDFFIQPSLSEKQDRPG